RGRTVTGVQTCALPISLLALLAGALAVRVTRGPSPPPSPSASTASPRPPPDRAPRLERLRAEVQQVVGVFKAGPARELEFVERRSEERRVGKDGGDGRA